MNTIRKTVRLVTLVELPDNPHQMSDSEYALLKESIKNDGGTQTNPILGWLIHDDETRQVTAGILILSGNHRKRACLDVKIESQEIIVITDYLTPEQRWYIALRHNNLHGTDDLDKLVAAYKKISSPILKSMTGLTDKKLGLMKPASKLGTTKPGLLYNVIGVVFAPRQLEDALAALELAKQRVQARTLLLAAYQDYDTVMETLASVKKKTGITNVAAQFAYIFEVFNKHADDNE